jgi:hypothetical protein
MLNTCDETVAIELPSLPMCLSVEEQLSLSKESSELDAFSAFIPSLSESAACNFHRGGESERAVGKLSSKMSQLLSATIIHDKIISTLNGNDYLIFHLGR